MADKDKPEETTDKKKGLLSGSKVPLDAVLLVVAPFITFVLLFMYAMGLLPPRPMTVKVVGAAPMEEAQEPVVNRDSEPRLAVMPVETADQAPEVPAGTATEDPAAVVPESPDVTLADAGGPVEAEQPAEEAASEPSPAADIGEGEATEEAAGTDEERSERIQRLAKVYEQMNASSVAAIVTNMREDDAVDILSSMKPRNAAKVLASLDPEKAAKLSLRLTE